MFAIKKPSNKYAWTVRVGEKGQIVIPKEARDLFHIKPGDSLLLLGDVNRGIAIPPQHMFAKIAEALLKELPIESEEEES